MFLYIGLFRKLGSVGSLKLQVGLELSEFRSFFEGINSLSASSFNTMIKQCPDFKKSYEYFVDTQSQSVRHSLRVVIVCLSSVFLCCLQ